MWPDQAGTCHDFATLDSTLYVQNCVLKSTGKHYDFANVKPCDTKDTITYCLRVKFADSIESDMNVVQ